MPQGSEDHVESTCAFCQGSGEASGGQCKACGGDGSVLVTSPPTKCSFCRGTGKVGAIRCGRCTGTGWIRVLRQMEAQTEWIDER